MKILLLISLGLRSDSRKHKADFFDARHLVHTTTLSKGNLMPHEISPLQPPPAELGDWLKAAAMHFDRMETDEKYRNEVKRRTYGLDTFPPLANEKEAEADT
jgi:hypothetical protein